MTGEGEEKRREEKEKNCHMLITSPLNEGAVIKTQNFLFLICAIFWFLQI
jgi:hypothetical protein